MRPPNGGPGVLPGGRELPRHPFAAAPVAATLVLPERKPFVRSPTPIVFMNDNAGAVGKVISLMRMPADAALAYDRRGCTEAGRRDEAGADRGGGKDFLEHFCLVS